MMPGDWFSKRLPGDSPVMPAEIYNRLVSQAQGMDLDTTGQPQAGLFRQTGIVKVRNDTGTDLGQFAIVGLDEPLILPDQDDGEFRAQEMFSGTAPVTGGDFGILLEPLSQGAIGWAVVSGVVKCRLAVNPDSIHDYADVFDGGMSQLANAAAGSAKVLWYEDSGSSEQWAIVRLGDRHTPDEIIDARYYVVTMPAYTSSWGGLWATAQSYTVGKTVLHQGRGFYCFTAHTSAAETEPGVGEDWLENWTLSPAVILTGSTLPAPTDFTNSVTFIGDIFLCDIGPFTLTDNGSVSGNWIAEQLPWEQIAACNRVRVGSEGLSYPLTEWLLATGTTSAAVDALLVNLQYNQKNYSIVHRANWYIGSSADVPAYTANAAHSQLTFDVGTAYLPLVPGQPFQIGDIVLYNPAYAANEGTSITSNTGTSEGIGDLDAGLWLVTHAPGASDAMVWKRAPHTMIAGAMRSGMLVVVDIVQRASLAEFRIWLLTCGNFSGAGAAIAGGKTIAIGTNKLVFVPIPSEGVFCLRAGSVANGTYTVGAKLTGGGNNGTLTITNGVITAIQQAT